MDDLTRQIQKKGETDYQRTQKQKPSPPPLLKIGEYHPESGRYKVIYPNGGQVIAGVKLFNSSVPDGTPIRTTQAYKGQSISLDYKNNQPLPIQEEEEEDQIIVGILVDKTKSYDFLDIDPYNLYTDHSKYKASLSINSAYHTINPTVSFGNINPIGFFIGRLQNRTIKKIAIITEGIPDFPLPEIYRYYYFTPTGEGTFEKENYYSMGYDGNLLRYLGGTKVSNPGSYLWNISKIDIQVINFSTQDKSVESQTLTFRNQVSLNDEIVPSYIIESNNIYSETNVIVKGDYYSFNFYQANGVYAQVIKYKSTDNNIYYVLVAGCEGNPVSYQFPPGVLFWDIGEINNLNSKDNIASHVGFDWITVFTDGIGQKNVGANNYNIGIVNCYGCIGGIVLAATGLYSNDIGGFVSKPGIIEIFVPEKFLKGTNGMKIHASDLIFSDETGTHRRSINTPTGFAEKLSGAIGEMPMPLEKRSLIAPYRIPEYETNPYPISTYTPPGILERENKLILYSIFSKEKGRQHFG